jgi:hypothetical protein
MASTPWAILLCKFQDDLTEPKPRSFYEDFFTASGRGQQNLVEFFDDYSLGHVDLGASQVFGWFTLSQNKSDYKGSGVNPAGRWELVAWARLAATDAGVNLGPFSGTVVCMNVATDLWGGGGTAVCDPGSMQPSVLAQEVGHGFGLDHSRIDGSAADYMDRWDVMSTWDSCFMAAHPRWALIGPGLNAPNIDGRGWLDSARVWNASPPPLSITGWSREIELRPLPRRDLPGFLAARVGDRWLEFRTKEKWDAAIPRAAVLVHEFSYNHSYLIPSDSGSQDLVVGDATTWGSRPRRLRVEVLEIDETQRVARVNIQQIVDRPRPIGGRGVSRGVQTDGGGWVIVGGRPVRVPPRSPLVRVIRHVAAHEVIETSPDPRVRDTGRRETLRAIHADITRTLEEHEELHSPPKRVASRKPAGKPGTRKPGTQRRPKRRRR